MRALFAVSTLQLHIVLSQFPEHVDFQKEGEIFVKGEKYNILKLSKHVVKDHFLNFMQRRDEDPTKRVFLDKNGLRHIWSRFNNYKNLRKSEGGVSTSVKDDNSEVNGNIRDDIVHNEANKDENNKIQNKQTKDEDAGPKDEAINKIIGKRKPKRKPKSDVVDKIILKPALRTDASNRTMAVTYFYCPFFGVMSLSAYID
ncbi:hypothetical protein MSG28_015708 [Choristoneura fumiferana]|uniref:Uncharacterized protein n=1 Tax=Choristoneura fumiferana TaxID=7141 RepID=A0ACC0KBM9_CHOFU|nr:hypothetical protein MSG28_015708 [Choristoneura fumiferana]